MASAEELDGDRGSRIAATSRARAVTSPTARTVRRYHGSDSTAAEGVVTTIRFYGAKRVGDPDAESLQAVSEAKYLPLQVSAISGLEQAGRRLGTVLRRDHVNTVVTATQAAEGRKQLRRLDGIPSSLITRLERDGLINRGRQRQPRGGFRTRG